MIPSYIANIPECEDLLSVKRGIRSSLLFHIHPIPSNELSSNKKAKSKRLAHTLTTIEVRHGNKQIALQELFKRLILPIPPILHNFPSVGTHESIDARIIFRNEHLHSHLRETSQLLKECLSRYLGDLEKLSDTLTNQPGTSKPFLAIMKGSSGTSKQVFARYWPAKHELSLTN